MADAAISYKGEFTVDDIYELPEGQRAELVDGKWFDMATPSRVHQRIVTSLSGEGWRLPGLQRTLCCVFKG